MTTNWSSVLPLKSLAIAALALAASRLVIAQQLPSESERLIATGRLWITIKYFHPYLAYRNIDWDKALVDALPKIRSAQNASEYAAVIGSMLDPLRDPATYVESEPVKSTTPSLNFENTSDGTLIVSQSNQSSNPQPYLQQLATQLRSAHDIVFDLRGGDFLGELIGNPAIANELDKSRLEVPGQRTWIHNGLEPYAGSSSGIFHSAFYTKPGSHIDGDPAAPERKIAFVVDERSVVPSVACALAGAGEAVILSESPHYQIAGVETVAIAMGAGVNAVVRLSEPIFPDGAGLPDAVRVSHAIAREQAQAALSKLSAPQHSALLPSYPAPTPDRAYAESAYPATEYRILAAYKIWGVFRYFFAYKDLMDEDWDNVFNRSLPKLLSAKDAREYNLAVAEMVTSVQDSDATVQSETLAEYFGKAPAGLRLRLIEKKPVITGILDDEAKKAGVHIGDIITKVDGEDIIQRFRREALYISSSTLQSLGFSVMQRILNGPDGSPAVLTIKDRNDNSKQVTLKRSTAYIERLRDQRSGEIVKLLPGNIGYVDLDRLQPGQVNAIFDKFRDTKAIIFDMRGCPRETASLIAPRLTEEKDVPVAIFTGPLALRPDLVQSGVATSSASYFFVQTLPQTNKVKYKGKTVMLIDERTIDQGEHAGLFFEVANKTEFIGSPSAGADGEVTNFVIPGGIIISFSGHDVRHANGGKLQRLGLQPAISVSPTLSGVRAGRDEVLEKATEYVSGEEALHRLAAIH